MEPKILQDIGLTDGEIRVYLALIRLGPSTTGPITDKSRVSSSKIYHILEKLMQKGIVSYTIKEKTRYYQAEDPSKIRDYVDQKEKDLVKQKEDVEKLIPQLQLQQQLDRTKNETQIYKGFKGIQTIADHMYSTLRRGDIFYNLGIPSEQQEKYHSYWNEDHRRRVKLGIKCYMLFSQKTPRRVVKNRNSFKDCDARFMPFPIETPSWMLIYKNTTVIVLQGKEPVAIEIINDLITKSFKEYFEAFWKLTKPMK